MRTHEKVLFEECPLCGQAKITMEKPRRFPFSKPEINSCSNCSAEFAAKDGDKFQLVFCEPHRLVGRHNCGNRIFRGCYLDATLSRLEWQKIAQGGESQDFSKFLEMNTEFQRGLLPTYPSKGLPFTLERDEVVHYVSSPVYQDERKPSWRKPSEKGVFFLTNKRIVFACHPETVTITLDDVEQVEDSPPGFLVKEKSSFEPHYFFPPPYDPVFAAVRGAIRNLKRKKQV